MADNKKPNPLSFKYKKDAAEAEKPYVHKYVCGAVCETDSKGFATPNNRSLNELVVDASEGSIPLWAKGSMLRWRFQDRSLAVFRKPEAAKQYLRELISEGIMLWENAPPVKFKEVDDNWDFEVVMRPEEKCSPNGCVLASAFFPDAGRHELVFYPTLFKQSRKEQVETLAHEIGHIFGLRHFFANITETQWRSEIFGKHTPFSIMNYGDKSRMTNYDKSDLIKLYSLVWAKELTEINGTKIKQVKPFSSGTSTKIVLDLAALLS